MPESELRRMDDVIDKLARIDERTISTVAALEEIRKTMVTKVEFAPTKLVVYGMVAFILMAVLGAIATLVISQGGTP